MSNEQSTQAQILANHAATKLGRSPAYNAGEKQRDLRAQQMLEEIAAGDNVVVEADELARLRALEQAAQEEQEAPAEDDATEAQG
jgi:hypothetical protein